jgi:hypothetical protein
MVCGKKYGINLPLGYRQQKVGSRYYPGYGLTALFYRKYPSLHNPEQELILSEWLYYFSFTGLVLPNDGLV